MSHLPVEPAAFISAQFFGYDFTEIDVIFAPPLIWQVNTCIYVQNRSDKTVGLALILESLVLFRYSVTRFAESNFCFTHPLQMQRTTRWTLLWSFFCSRTRTRTRKCSDYTVWRNKVGGQEDIYFSSEGTNSEVKSKTNFQLRIWSHNYRPKCGDHEG